MSELYFNELVRFGRGSVDKVENDDEVFKVDWSFNLADVDFKLKENKIRFDWTVYVVLFLCNF